MRRAGREIVLSPKEIALLEYSLRTPGAPLPRTNFVEEVWRMQGVSLTNVVDVYIYYLRRKIDAGSDRPLIRTIRGVGYQIGGNQLSSQAAVDHYPYQTLGPALRRAHQTHNKPRHFRTEPASVSTASRLQDRGRDRSHHNYLQTVLRLRTQKAHGKKGAPV